MAFYSWPSRGTLSGYASDESSIEASEGCIADYLYEMATRTHAARVHLLAHSMGNRGVLRAVDRIAASASKRSGKPFDQIVLAAADVDQDTFRRLSVAYQAVARRTTCMSAARIARSRHPRGCTPTRARGCRPRCSSCRASTQSTSRTWISRSSATAMSLRPETSCRTYTTCCETTHRRSGASVCVPPPRLTDNATGSSAADRFLSPGREHGSATLDDRDAETMGHFIAH
jgi:hypothetical protein